MPNRRIGLACPLCDSAGLTAHLYEQPPSLATLCEGNPAHKWTDISELRAMAPRKLEMPLPAVAVQQNRVPLTVQVPQSLDAQLRSKYGDTLNENLIALLNYGAQPDFIVLDTQDLDRIQSRSGSRPKSGGELFGQFFALGEEVNDLRLELRSVQRSAQVKKTGTGVLVDLEDQLPKAAMKANEASLTVEEMISNYVRLTLENDWSMV